MRPFKSSLSRYPCEACSSTPSYPAWMARRVEWLLSQDGRLAEPTHVPELLFLSAAGAEYAEKLRRRATAL